MGLETITTNTSVQPSHKNLSPLEQFEADYFQEQILTATTNQTYDSLLFASSYWLAASSFLVENEIARTSFLVAYALIGTVHACLFFGEELKARKHKEELVKNGYARLIDQ